MLLFYAPMRYLLSFQNILLSNVKFITGLGVVFFIENNYLKTVIIKYLTNQKC